MNERDLFTAALRHEDPAAYVRAACAGNEPLRRRVEALLSAHRRAGAFLEPAPASGPPTVGASVLHSLAAEAPWMPRLHLRDPLTEDATPVSLPGSPELPALSADTAGRYQLFGELGHGGMGAVLKGRDTDLGRDVAVKVLLDAHKDKVELLHRFVEEAQVGGQLQHPGIVPVYELGQFPDRRPFFAMKLVKGQTLAKLLRQRPEPADELPRFVQVFAQVCQAIGYAHARGVIHRDLKPGNVMVGSFGEVQVMDWGLAKVLRQAAEPADEEPTQIRTVRSGGSETPGAGSDTRPGSVLGTPAYMAPEQANGEVERLDERADVFGLGAILCEILTGQPPYTGRDGDEVYQKAVVGGTADALARLDGCGADAALIALAKHCLATDPAGRPRDAGAVAQAVTAYQESVAARLRQAELAQAAEAARVEEAKATAAAERRARRLTLGLAAALLLLGAAGAAGGLWAQRQHAEQEAEAARQRQAVAAALDKAAALRQQARWAEARAILEQTRDQLGETGPEDLRQRVGQAAADLALVGRLEAIRLKRATWVAGRFDNRSAEQDYAAAFRLAGLGEQGQPAETVAARVRASAVGQPLVAALDDWAAVAGDPARRAWLLEVARRADPDPWGDRFRAPPVWGDRPALERLAAELLRDEVQLEKRKAPALAALGEALFRVQADAVPLLVAAQAHRPDDFWLNFWLGKALARAKRWDEAVGYYRAALAVRPGTVAVLNNLGNVLCDGKHDYDGAIAYFRAALARDAHFAYAHHNLGIALQAQKRLEEAVTEFRAALQIDPNYVQAHINLGVALKAIGRPDEAIAAYRAAVRLDPKHAPAHFNLGNLLRDQGRPDEAMTAFRAAIRSDPHFAWPHYNLGNLLLDQGKTDEALTEFRAALRIDPKYARGYHGLARALTAQGRRDEAIQAYRQALALRQDLPDALCNLGLLLRGPGRYDEALALLRRGHALGIKQPGWPIPSAELVRQTERMAALDPKLPAILKGEAQPADTAERLTLAQLCVDRAWYAAAVRFWADAFAADPTLAWDVNTQHRYAAARAAAQAGTGVGRDDPPPDGAARARLRHQALTWLRADLTVYAKFLTAKNGRVTDLVRQRMQHWQQDADFRGVRGDAALARLPEAERVGWQSLWADVTALQNRAAAPK